MGNIKTEVKVLSAKWEREDTPYPSMCVKGNIEINGTAHTFHAQATEGEVMGCGSCLLWLNDFDEYHGDDLPEITAAIKEAAGPLTQGTLGFLNYHPSEGFTVAEYPAYVLDDMVEFVDSVDNGSTTSARIDGAIGVLEDGSLWSDDQQGLLEEIHSFICETGCTNLLT